jgi:hypothetical protein
MPDSILTKNYDQLLTDWSKWLISINFLSAVGCVVALKTGKPVPAIGMFFFIAILCFALSMLTSSLFTLLLARNEDAETIVKHPHFVWMAVVQWIFFATGLFFVLLWIARVAGVM